VCSRGKTAASNIPEIGKASRVLHRSVFAMPGVANGELSEMFLRRIASHRIASVTPVVVQRYADAIILYNPIHAAVKLEQPGRSSWSSRSPPLRSSSRH
jgi:hypothetical protein